MTRDFNFIKNIYFTNIEKIAKHDGDYFFKRAMIITFDNDHYVIFYLAGNDYENLHITYENPFKNKVTFIRMKD